MLHCLPLCVCVCVRVCVCVGPRAADWKLDAPDWTGRMRVTARGKVAYVKLEDKISGEREADRTLPLFTGTADDENHFMVLVSCSPFPSLLLISSKVTQPASKHAVYFEAKRLIISVCLYWSILVTQHACCPQFTPYND